MSVAFKNYSSSNTNHVHGCCSKSAQDVPAPYAPEDEAGPREDRSALEDEVVEGLCVKTSCADGGG